MPKIVLNSCYGGFSISREAAKHMADNGSKQAEKELSESGRWFGYGYVKGFDGPYKRDDPLLVAAVEALGDKANGQMSKLRIADVPDGIEWEIEEYDGKEWVSEKHRTW